MCFDKANWELFKSLCYSNNNINNESLDIDKHAESLVAEIYNAAKISKGAQAEIKEKLYLGGLKNVLINQEIN